MTKGDRIDPTMMPTLASVVIRFPSNDHIVQITRIMDCGQDVAFLGRMANSKKTLLVRPKDIVRVLDSEEFMTLLQEANVLEKYVLSCES